MTPELQRIAVLIDADNAQAVFIERILTEVSKRGRVVVKRAYGNWRKDALKSWIAPMKRLAIKAEQQFDYVAGKNATDILLSIDAVELALNKNVDGFALVSSDSDFAPLVIKLREYGAYVFGVGQRKAPEAFRNACDEFWFVETFAEEEARKNEELAEKKAPVAPPRSGVRETLRRWGEGIVRSAERFFAKTKAEPEPERGGVPMTPKIHRILKEAADEAFSLRGDDFVSISFAGARVKKEFPGLRYNSLGFASLSKLLAAFPERYQVKRDGDGAISHYKCLK